MGKKMAKRENPVDHVLDRMVEAVLGENAHFKSHADALGIPAETIKSWRRRGEVPPGKLTAFAQDWKVPVDWLLHGPEGQVVLGGGSAHVQAMERESASYGALADDERKLLENYRKLPAEVKETLQLVASIASRPQVPGSVKPPRVRVRAGELPSRKFRPPAVVSGEPTPAGPRKKRGGA